MVNMLYGRQKRRYGTPNFVYPLNQSRQTFFDTHLIFLNNVDTTQFN